MKSKIKSIFKTIFSSRKTRIMFCFTILSCLLLITVTCAWFVSMIELPHSTIETGNLDIVVKGYDSNGTFVSTIVTNKEYNKNDEDYINVNAPLFSLENLKCPSLVEEDENAISSGTCYISIENSGTLDLDYVLAFNVNGDSVDLRNIGGFWYRIERLNIPQDYYSLATDKNGVKLNAGYEPKKAYYDKVIQKYIGTVNKKVSCGPDCLNQDNTYTHNCMECDSQSRNLITLPYLSEYGSLDLNNDKRTIYRIDIGLRKDAIEDIYTNLAISINGEVYATQKGALVNPDGTGAIITVTDERSLDAAIDNALPGDTIQLGKTINYNGDLIFNKCLNINTYGNDLIINGNLIYNYTSKHTLKLNMSSGGNIKVLCKNEAGGNLQINTPNSEVVITGNNYITNLYVERDALLNATKAPETQGIYINGANIVNKDGDPKDIDIAGETRLTLGYGASLTLIEAIYDSSNIEIINYGTIETINLSKMLLLDSDPNSLFDTKSPQICIDNYNNITKAIQLPSWAVPYNQNSKEGNTLIIREFGALDMSVVEDLSIYTSDDIIDYNIEEECVVPEFENRNDSLIVYYGNKEGSTKTISDLLTEYFTNEVGLVGHEVSDAINNVKRLIIYSIEGKIVSTVDLSFMKNMYALEDIDLAKALIQNNEIPKNAFLNKTTLRKVALPDTITTLNEGAFSGTSIKTLTIPTSVTYWHYNAFPNVTYVFFNSPTPVAPSNYGNYVNLAYKKQFIFVDEASIEAYQRYYGYSFDHSPLFGRVYANVRIFPKGEITDDGQHVVRKTSIGYELVCYTGSETDIIAGYNLYLNGEEINIMSIGSYCYSNVPNAFNVSFVESITQINERAFFNSKVKSIDFNNVRYVGDCAFYYCSNLGYLDTKKVTEVGVRAFAFCTNIFEMICPELEIVRMYAFSDCRNLAQISFYELKLLEQNAVYHYSGGNRFYNVVRLFFYNDSFANVSYSTFDTTENAMFKTFVKEELISDFCATKCVASKLVYPICDIVGEYYYSRTFTVEGETVETKINLGEYLVKGDVDNATLISYNYPHITEDFEVPGSATVVDENGNSITKTITSVGAYAFQRVTIEPIKFTFADSIKTVGAYMFNDHTNVNNLVEGTFYNRIIELDLNNVEIIDTCAFGYLRQLKKVNAPNVLVINKSVFSYCGVLQEINAPKVEEIYDSAFNNCSRLFRVEFPSIRIVQGEYIFNSCTNLISIIFGENLEIFEGYRLIGSTTTKLREIIFLGDFVITKTFLYEYYSNVNLKIYITESTISQQLSSYASYFRERGNFRVGDYIIYNYNNELSFNMGDYFVNLINIDGVDGYSICSYNRDVTDVASEYVLPSELTPFGQTTYPVIRLGLRCFLNVNLGLISPVNESKENFIFHENLLEIGPSAFAYTTIRVSDFKNIKTIDNSAFCQCYNLYYVRAPKLEYIGSSGFYECSNIYYFDAKNLAEIKSNALTSLTKCKVMLTNITSAEDNKFLGANAAGYVTFATTPGSVLTGVKPNQWNTGRLSLTNGAYLDSNSAYAGAAHMLYDIEEVALRDWFEYEVIDGDNNVIYTFDMPRFATDKNESGLTIIKCLIGYSETDDFVIPSTLDDIPVVSIGANSFTSRTELVNKNLIFGDNIKTIGSSAFSGLAITGVLNLNNVTSVGAEAFKSNALESVVAPKLTTLGNHAFFNSTTLTSFYFDSISNLNLSSLKFSPNLKYIYTERTVKISYYDTRVSDITFVINAEVSSSSDIPKDYWSVFNNITLYVPYNSVQYYEEVFSDTTKYKNFTILPIGVIAEKTNEETNGIDRFILIESDGLYNYNTESFEKVYELISIISTSSNIIIPDEWESMDDPNVKLPISKLNIKALQSAEKLTDLTLPRYLRTCADEAFIMNDVLKNIFVDENNDHFISDGGVLYEKKNFVNANQEEDYYLELVCYPKNHGHNYTILEKTKVIRSYSFKNCSNLFNIEVNSDIEVIGANAFEGTKLTSITFTSNNVPLVTGTEIFDKANTGLILYVPSAAITLFSNSVAFVNYKLIGYNN